jgi:hypothetical protein
VARRSASRSVSRLSPTAPGSSALSTISTAPGPGSPVAGAVAVGASASGVGVTGGGPAVSDGPAVEVAAGSGVRPVGPGKTSGVAVAVAGVVVGLPPLEPICTKGNSTHSTPWRWVRRTEG